MTMNSLLRNKIMNIENIGSPLPTGITVPIDDRGGIVMIPENRDPINIIAPMPLASSLVGSVIYISHGIWSHMPNFTYRYKFSQTKFYRQPKRRKLWNR